MVDCNQGGSTSSGGAFGFSRLPPIFSIPASMMGYDLNCVDNCSGHGECYDGQCFCEVQYSGGTCHDPNLSYFIAFSTIFYVICSVSFVQLILCIKSEYQRMKTPSVLRACRVTTQKALYLLICIATAIRGFYFSSPENASMQWTSSLMSAYYPVMLTGSSLVVCFWAEVFHLRDLRYDRPTFLSKSFLGFVAFNIMTYSLLLAELVLLQFTDSTDHEKSLLSSIFNTCYAVLMLIVVIFFLIYGVEVFFKVRGGFTEGSLANEKTNTSQLHQSRLGLVSQAILLLITVGFMMSDVLGSFWKDKVPVLSRNYHNIIFRVVELGMALWFPCVLWNCVRPEQLWILNPRKLLNKLESDSSQPQPCGEAEALVSPVKGGVVVKTVTSSVCERLPDCFICYDSERTDAGALIQPCSCKGDVSAVHHECLKKWLIESSENPDNVRCKVCNDQYELQRERICFPRGVSPSHWLQTAAIVCIMSSSVAGACLIVKLFTNVGLRTLAVGVALLVEYVCLRLLGFNVLSAYQRAKFSAVKILGRKFSTVPNSFSSVAVLSGSTPQSVMTVRLAGEHIETILEQTPMVSAEDKKLANQLVTPPTTLLTTSQQLTYNKDAKILDEVSQPLAFVECTNTCGTPVGINT